MSSTTYPPIFHGTDARIFLMNDRSRLELKRDLIDLIDYMVPFFKPYYDPRSSTGEQDRMENLKEHLDEPTYDRLYDALKHDWARREGLKSWQYQDDIMYFSGCYKHAVTYAHKHCVCGEIGTIATDILLAIEILNLRGWNPDEDKQRTINKIKKLYFGEHFPMLFIYDNYTPEELRDASGITIVKDIVNFSIIITDPVEIYRGNILYLRSEFDADVKKAAREAIKFME